MTARCLSSLLPIAALALAGCAARPAQHAAATPPAAPAPVATTTPAGPVIVELRGRHNVVTVTSSPAGPRYSVRTRAGEMLVSNATLDELRAQRVDLYDQLDPVLASTNDDGDAAKGDPRTRAVLPRGQPVADMAGR